MMSAESRQAAPKRRWILWIFLLLLIGAAAYGLHRLYPHATLAMSAGGKRMGRFAMRSVPVVVATARRGDLPIYLDAPGTVIPMNTVTVRTRVDGQIMKIYYTEGDRVKKGDPLVEIDPRPFQVQLTLAQGQLARDEASLHNAELDRARYQSAGRAATQQQLDTAIATVEQFKAALKVDQGQIDSAKLQLTYCHITAPISGQIGLRLVDQGNIVHASDTTGLVVITQLDPISVVFSLNEDDLPAVLKADHPDAKLPVEVRNRDRRILLAKGFLSAVDSQIDLTTLTARFKAAVDNKDRALFPNQAVNVRLLVDTEKGATLVPAAAIQRSPQSDFVYVVKKDDTVEMRTIKPGHIEGDTASIEHGLSPGEVVVTEGVDKLVAGMKVTIPGAEKAPGHAGESGKFRRTRTGSSSAEAPAASPGHAPGASARGKAPGKRERK